MRGGGTLRGGGPLDVWGPWEVRDHERWDHDRGP